MKIEQRFYENINGWSDDSVSEDIQLVLAFSSESLIKEKTTYSSLHTFYPNAEIVLVSTSWEIMEDEVKDGSISVNAFIFDKTPIKVIAKEVSSMDQSGIVWKSMAEELNTEGLSYSLMFLDGLSINADAFLEWIKSIFSPEVWIVWALAGAGLEIKPARVSLNWVPNDSSMAIIIWFYGDSIQVWDASFWWWDTFWIERVITKSEWNIIYEVDGEPVLDLYKRYLWEKAQWLPGSGIMFPISISKQERDDSVVRSLYSVNEEDKSIAFTWETPQWYNISFMKTTFDDLIDWVSDVAELCLKKNSHWTFALFISCTWRRAIFKQRVEDEIETVRDILWDDCIIWGLYAYGEIWINGNSSNYEFHNQTMTMALFSEKQ